MVVIAAVLAGVLIPLAGSRAEPTPTVTAYAYGKAVAVAPQAYCSLQLQDCRNGGQAALHVPPGRPLQLSLPKAIADAPWRLIAVYQAPGGRVLIEQHLYPRGSAYAVTVASERTPPLQLGGIEIQIPSAVLDQRSGSYFARGIWDIKTD